MALSNIVWIDFKINDILELNTNENIKFLKELKSLINFKVKCFNDLYESMNYLKTIKYEETFIIVSRNLFTKLILNLKKNSSDLYINPKIIVFTQSEDFVKSYLDIQENYKYFTTTSFKKLKKYILNSSKIKEILLNEEDKDNMIFDFDLIDNKEKLILPILFKMLIKINPKDNINNIPLELLANNYSRSYYDDYSKLRELYKIIKDKDDNNINDSSKEETKNDKIKNINKIIDNDKKNEYLSYIKVLFEGIKLKSKSLSSSNNILYRVGFLSNDFINEIKNNLNNKKDGLPGIILFTKSFLTFTKDEIIANHPLDLNKNVQLFRVLFILEEDNRIDYSLLTRIDFEDKVLFLPFSSFEIKNISKKNSNYKYEIKLSYLGRYFENFKNDEKITGNKIPDSKFQDEIIKFGLIDKDNKNINIKKLLEKYDEYKNEYQKDYKNIEIIKNEIIKTNTKKEKKNLIIGEIYVNKDNKKIRIINSCDLNNRANKEEIERIKITIDGKLLDKFSYFYKFNKKGKYIIEYKFESNIEKTCYMFSECEALTYLDLTNLKSDSITDMSSMFSGCKLLQKIIFFDFKTDNVTDMSYLFSGCKSLKNIDLSEFNTEKVTNMNNMFEGCELLENIDSYEINAKNVTNMSNMFYECKSLSNLDFSNFKNFEQLTDISSMFSGCLSLNNINLSNLITKNITDMSFLFSGCKSLKNIDLSNFNTENIIKMNNMFSGCEALTNLDLSYFKNTKILNDVSYLFSGCKSLENINISNLNTQNVNNMSHMFAGCELLKNIIDLAKINTENVIYMNNMFYECKSLSNLDLSSFQNTEKLIDISSMFSGCESLIDINLSKLNTKNVIDMSYMLFGCKSLKNIDLSNFNTENVSDMSWMFSGCKSLIDINLSNFKVNHINNISSMFAGCKKLETINLSQLSTEDDTKMSCIFFGCKALTKVNLLLFNTINEINLFSMFSGSKPSIECNNKEAKEAMSKEL